MDYYKNRAATGDVTYKNAFGASPRRRRTPLIDSLRGFVFGEVWSRPGLSRRYRWIVSLCCLADAGDGPQIERYVRGALTSGDLSLSELREVILHFAVYCGWPKAELFDDATTKVAEEMGLNEAPAESELSLEPKERIERGEACWESVMTFMPPDRTQPYSHAGMLNFVFGEMWDRPGLDRVSRRYVTLTCVGLCDGLGPIVSHIYAAMKTNQVAQPEMREFVLHFATYAGWPKASAMHSLSEQIAGRLDGPLPHDLM